MGLVDIEFVVFRHPDPAAAAAFMRDYGLLDRERRGETVYMRSWGDAPFSWMTSPGEATFVGIGFRVEDEETLTTLARRFDAAIADCPHPGGGRSVVVHDPDGRRLEFVFGAARSAPLDVGGAPIVWNDAFGHERRGRYQRPAHGPSHVLRLGHVALFTPTPSATIEWYRDNLGMRPSELIRRDPAEDPIASFMHIDRGATWTDHHTIAIVGAPAAGMDHVSFEVRDFDDLGMGHMAMKDRGHRHRWGIGRHFHGSQVFDYWTDPAGFHVEHFVDGDLVNADTPTLDCAFGRDTLLQWGPDFPGL